VHPGDGGEQGFATVQPAGSSLVVPPPLLFSSTDHDGPCRQAGAWRCRRAFLSTAGPNGCAQDKDGGGREGHAHGQGRADELQPW